VAVEQVFQHLKWMFMFHDRRDAGRRLAERLQEYAWREDVVVAGLLRGGIPVAFEIAQKQHVPLDVLLVRKLGAPDQPELAMGAVAPGGARVLDHSLIRKLGLSEQQVGEMISAEEEELHRREQLYADVRPQITARDKTVIAVDDGIATGASMMAAVSVLRAQGAKKVVVAVPVAPPHAVRDLSKVADEVVSLKITDYFPAVGFFYRDFQQITDEEVRDLLRRASQHI
jgi:putative phosphoribosyl transferase